MDDKNVHKKVEPFLQFKNEKGSREVKDRIWKNIESQSSASASTKDATVKHIKSTKNAKARIVRFALGAVAASLALFFIWKGNATTLPNAQEIHVPFAQNETILLPDGSTIKVNAGSEISYDEAAWDTKREIHLEGEAFFEVVKGKPFTVITPVGKIEVLGTSFNVFTRDTEFKVACKTGKVKVSLHDIDESRTLTKNELAYLFDGSFIKESKEEEVNIAWLNNQFEFNNISLKKVFQEVERQFDVDIQSDFIIENTFYEGTFDKTSLDEVLDQICWPMNLTFEKTEGQIVITKKGS